VLAWRGSGASGAWVVFIGSAALAALALHLIWRQSAFGVGVAALLVGLAFSRWRTRRKVERLLRSGDVRGVLRRWSISSGSLPNAGTMAPLMTATAFAAYGWIARARDALANAERGPAWEAALEHRLFLDAMLCAFEGDLDTAVERAESLQRLPVPPAAPKLVERIRTLRGAVLALARAFAHESKAGDRELLLDASSASPLVHWAMRYAAAIAAVDAGEVGEAARLLEQAPEWPEESCFARFHREIGDEIRRRGD